MSKAIILHAFLRLARPGTLMTLVMFVLVYPIAIATFMSRSTNISFDLGGLLNMFAGPMIISLAFTFVSSSIGNTKSLDDGEYLALLFSRPLFRWKYVISKWLAGSSLVNLVIVLQTLIFMSLVSFIARNNHIFSGSGDITNGFVDVVNLVLNALQAVALVVMLFSLPARIGVMCFVGLFFIAFGAPLMCNSISDTSLWLNGNFRHIVEAGSGFLRDLMYSPIDLEPYFNSIQVLWLPAITYISNLSLYLWVAVVVMNNREFFYTN